MIIMGEKKKNQRITNNYLKKCSEGTEEREKKNGKRNFQATKL